MLSMRLSLIAVAALALRFAASAQTLAPTPPMGWNSWDAYGLTITEDQFRANVKVLHEKLQPFGYNYAVIDEGWFFFNPEARSKPDTLEYALDVNGRYVPVPARFPSALPAGQQASASTQTAGTLIARIESTSFAPLSAWVHAQGLKFGIHIVRGIPRASVERNLPVAGSSFHAQDVADTSDTCPWDPTNWGVKDNAAGQAWYDSLIQQYATWGVDLLKVDCISDRPYKADEIRMIRLAIDKTSRPMVLSLSPGPTDPRHAEEVAALATMWRISNDVWDVWDVAPDKDFPQPIKGQFARAAQWSPLDLPEGRYPDLDMLPFGELRPSAGWGEPRHTRLTPDEQQTLMTLWAIERSPLIVGANLTLLDDATLRLLTNRDLLRINQTAEGHAGRVEGIPEPLQVWAGNFPDAAGKPGKMFAALFNLGDSPLAVDRSLRELDLVRAQGPPSANLREVWSGRELGKLTRVKLTLPAHACVLLETQ
jgi:hypothetical protein